MRAAIVIAALLGVAAIASAQQDYTVTVTQQGNFTVPAGNWSFQSTDGQPWSGGSQVKCMVEGQALKQIKAGTVQYQFWQEYEEHFISQSSQPYFQCDNKGCDPTTPVSLFLSDPFSVPTNYQLKFDVTLPAGSADKPKSFHMVMWGSDQDHSPYDFLLELHYNFTSSA
eukprot:CAMPEP_0203815018 /NCGR_PEP_ID=MMETSP0115-20131106/7420_1 /ASSEMBLY_ACC=CAM_ASM_000227 /TAXON_ID=33651 /ORGANISM="Bicosoecid sp, Strain ms1" /LENGTH=168 /DNA_ID=CAMNT_0050723907 /DNA_START=36 /DNA_END=542 /DNA_ORIENTATION=+